MTSLHSKLTMSTFAGSNTATVPKPVAAALPGVRIMVTPAPLYSNLGKGTKDLLSKGFPATHKVEVTTTAERGLQFVASAEKKSDSKSGDVVVATFQPKFKYAARGSEFIATIDTNNQIKGEVSRENLVAPGLKATIKAQTGASQDVEAALEYKHESGTVATSLVHVPLTGRTNVVGNFTVAPFSQAITLGAETRYSFQAGQHAGLNSITGTVNYRGLTHDLTAFVKSDAGVVTPDVVEVPRLYSVGAHLHYIPSKDVAFASSIEHDLQKNKTKVVLGGSQKVDASTEIKAKLSSEGRLGLGAAKQLTPAVKATIGTELDTFNISGTTPKIGVHFDIKA